MQWLAKYEVIDSDNDNKLVLQTPALFIGKEMFNKENFIHAFQRKYL